MGSGWWVDTCTPVKQQEPVSNNEEDTVRRLRTEPGKIKKRKGVLNTEDT